MSTVLYFVVILHWVSVVSVSSSNNLALQSVHINKLKVLNEKETEGGSGGEKVVCLILNSILIWWIMNVTSGGSRHGHCNELQETHFLHIICVASSVNAKHTFQPLLLFSLFGPLKINKYFPWIAHNQYIYICFPGFERTLIKQTNLISNYFAWSATKQPQKQYKRWLQFLIHYKRHTAAAGDPLGIFLLPFFPLVKKAEQEQGGDPLFTSSLKQEIQRISAFPDNHRNQVVMISRPPFGWVLKKRWKHSCKRWRTTTILDMIME